MSDGDDQFLQDYAYLAEPVAGLGSDAKGRDLLTVIADTQLVPEWVNHYSFLVPSAALSVIPLSAERNADKRLDAPAQYYLFDHYYDRLVAAWAVSFGRSTHDRSDEGSRRGGHPMPDDLRELKMQKGHALAHLLGGGSDINYVPQFGRINQGQFKVLENQAANTPGSLYFTHWQYGPVNPDKKWSSQTPIGVYQGLIVPGQPIRGTHFGNGIAPGY